MPGETASGSGSTAGASGPHSHVDHAAGGTPSTGEAGIAMSAPGGPETAALADGALGVGLYLFAWTVMIVAMMYPSSARVFQSYADTLDDVSLGARIAGVGTAAATYTAGWTLLGTVPLAASAIVPIASLFGEWRSPTFGLALLLLGAYQLSPIKRRSLRHCRAPRTNVGDASGGVRHGLRFGSRFGRHDVGSCWVWMGFLVLVGSMNLLWMALITGLLSFEQLAPEGEFLAGAIGVVAVASGAGIVVFAAI